MQINPVMNFFQVLSSYLIILIVPKIRFFSLTERKRGGGQ